MFVIHRDQIETFAAQRREAFEQSAAAIVGERLGRAVAQADVRASVDRALRCRVDCEPEVLQWIALEQVAGGALGERWPWALAILEDAQLRPIGKVRTLVRAAADRGHDVRAIDFVGAWKP
jgi:hypothetical protein